MCCLTCGSVWFCATVLHRLLVLQQPIREYYRENSEVSDSPLEIRHWTALTHLLEYLAGFKEISLRMESDTVPIGGQTLRYLVKLKGYLDSYEEETAGRLRDLAPFNSAVLAKYTEEVDCVNWFWALCF